MTSWIRAPRQKVPPPTVKEYYQECDGGELAAQFNTYLFGVLASRAGGGRLLVNDIASTIGANTRILRKTFVDSSGVDWVDSAQIRATSLSRGNITRIQNLLQAVPQAQYRPTAAEIFKFRPETAKRNSELEAEHSIPESIDLAIHIRAGSAMATRHISGQAFAQAIRDSKFADKPELSIFVMADTMKDLVDFRKAADPAWKVHAMPCFLPAFTSYLPNELQNLFAKDRVKAYELFVANIGVLRRIPNFIGCMSSHVARFYFLAAERIETFRSLDIQVFTLD